MAVKPGVKAIRCAACQLQICKSRDEPPHANLTEVTPESPHDGNSVSYLCKSCGVTIIRSADLTKPGWSSPRR